MNNPLDAVLEHNPADLSVSGVPAYLDALSGLFASNSFRPDGLEVWMALSDIVLRAAREADKAIEADGKRRVNKAIWGEKQHD